MQGERNPPTRGSKGRTTENKQKKTKQKKNEVIEECYTISGRSSGTQMKISLVPENLSSVVHVSFDKIIIKVAFKP